MYFTNYPNTDGSLIRRWIRMLARTLLYDRFRPWSRRSLVTSRSQLCSIVFELGFVLVLVLTPLRGIVLHLAFVTLRLCFHPVIIPRYYSSSSLSFLFIILPSFSSLIPDSLNLHPYLGRFIGSGPSGQGYVEAVFSICSNISLGCLIRGKWGK